MRWTYADSRAALTLRRWLARFGYGVPKAAVRTHVPWYVRGFLLIAVLTASIAGAAWVYDAGRRFAGFDSSESEVEIATLRSRVAEMDAELRKLRSVAHAAESTIQMEHAVQEQLALQVKALEQENVRLKEDLAFFESIASEGGSKSVTIDRFLIQAGDLPGQYLYRMLVAQQATKRDRDFEGALEFSVTSEHDGRKVTTILPEPSSKDRAKFRVKFRHFRRLEGVLRLPDELVPTGVEARLKQDGTIVASKAILLGEGR